MKEIYIPGSGWDTESVITGGIKIRLHNLVEESMGIINGFPFDEVYPFTNIFGIVSSATYGFPVIGFAGAYKQVEEAWNEWMWKFSQLLSRLDAVEALVDLNCILGNFHWTLQPNLHFEQRTVYSTTSMTGQVWGITDAPDPDFSIDSNWRFHCTQLGFNNWEELKRWK